MTNVVRSRLLWGGWVGWGVGVVGVGMLVLVVVFLCVYQSSGVP